MHVFEQIERYHTIAARMRVSAGKAGDSEIRRELLEIAVQYEKLAADIAQSLEYASSEGQEQSPA
jgi:hypothetical protein